MTLTLAELGIARENAIRCLETGWEMYEEVESMGEVPPWYNAAERALFCLAYGGYITHIRDIED